MIDAAVFDLNIMRHRNLRYRLVACKVQAEIKGQSIRESIDRALLNAVNRSAKIMRTGELK